MEILISPARASEAFPGSEAWRSGHVYSDLSLAINAATDGEGVFLADDLLCAHEIASGALVKALPETLRCAWYCAATHHERAGIPSVRTFRDWLHETATKDIAGDP